MVVFSVLDRNSTEQLDVCVFCDRPVLAREFHGHWKRDGVPRTVHHACKPRCAEHGVERVRIRGTFSFHPELKDGDVVERVTPCWALEGDDQTICACHRWLKTAKPGDMWA